jgi:uncharacterized protein YbjT (DUF2867 family)
MTRSATGKPVLPEGAVYVEGDLTDPASMLRAFAGADAVYLLTPLNPRETELGRNAISAAKSAGVQRMVLHSVHHANDAQHLPHFRSKVEMADTLKESGMEWAVIAPNSFFQNELNFRTVLTGPGIYPQILGPIGVSQVDCADVAAAAAECLVGSGHTGKTLPVVGSESHTGEDCARIWSAALGRPVRYMGDDVDAWAGMVRDVMPGWLVDDLSAMSRYFIEHGLRATEQEVNETRRLLGREPRAYESWVRETAAAWT